MSPEQKAVVKETRRLVTPVADAAVQVFYDRLFEIDPSTRPLFRQTNLAEQRLKIIAALNMVVQGLDHLDQLVGSIEALGRRHIRYGVSERHYESVGLALLWMLERMLGRAWTPTAAEAWSTAYGALANAMRHA